MMKPGPKFLPLGKSFQEHVAIFKLVQMMRSHHAQSLYMHIIIFAALAVVKTEKKAQKRNY